MGIGFTGKTKNSSGGQNWGMGFLLVFFPEEDTEAIVTKKENHNNNNVGLLSSSLSSSSSASPSFRRPNSTHLLSKAQFTISICAFLLFITLLLFTLSTFEPSSNTVLIPRRQLSQFSSSYSQYRRDKNSPLSSSSSHKSVSSSHALQGMGTLYRRGTRAMNDLIVAHVVESLTVHELKSFLRLLDRSALTSRSDLLLLFPSKSASFDTTILEENDSLLKLINHSEQMSSKGSSLNWTTSFDVTQFVKGSKKEKEGGEPIWGRRIRSNLSEGNNTESTRLSYGSVVGFDVDELDPENSLAGFLDHVPMSLRRWACYPMLLGRVRRNFKHIILVDVKEMLIFGDPFSRVRNTSPESVHLSTTIQSVPTRHGKKNSGKTHSTSSKSMNPSIIIGGVRGVRRLSSAMLTEIVRTSMQHNKKKNSATTEFGLFNQLVGNAFLLKNVNLILSTEPIPELSSFIALKYKPGSTLSISNFPVVRRGNNNIDVNFLAS